LWGKRFSVPAAMVEGAKLMRAFVRLRALLASNADLA
jgi:hypothetical protein